jgi:hypothetical protein
LFTDGRKLLTVGNLAQVAAGDRDSKRAGQTLPIYFRRNQSIGDITLQGNLLDITHGLAVKTDSNDHENTDSDPANNKIVLDVSDVLTDILAGFQNLSLLDQILSSSMASMACLGGIQDALDGEIFGFSLPLIGDKLADGAHFIGDFQAGF